MSLWKIAWRSIQQRALASALTAFSIGLGVALVVAVLVIYGVVNQAFRRGAQGYDLIVGAKGGQLQLVLNTVFHIGEPLENIPYSYYEEFVTGRFSPAVEVAIPVCMGHAYRGCPAVATIPEMFTRLTYRDNQKYEFAEGENFKTENPFDAVIGWEAARKTGLKLGDRFEAVPTSPSEGHGAEGHKPFRVVGILAPTGTPNDQVLFMNMEGFFRCPAHMKQDDSLKEYLAGALPGEAAEGPEPAHAGDEHAAEEEHTGEEQGDHDHVHKAVTAILVCTPTDARRQLGMILPEVINEGNVAQAVMPARVIADFFEQIVGNIQLILLFLAVLVVVVAGIGILVSIYNSMSDRRHEIAVMRALGAGRLIVMSVILMESILLALGGGLLGLLLGHGLTAALGPTISQQLHVAVDALQFQWVELILVPGLVLLAALVGYVPAVAAYRTDVAKSLTVGA